MCQFFPTEEEMRQFEAEQKAKWKRRVKYIQILKESAAKHKMQEQENLRLYQEKTVRRMSPANSDVYG